MGILIITSFSLFSQCLFLFLSPYYYFFPSISFLYGYITFLLNLTHSHLHILSLKKINKKVTGKQGRQSHWSLPHPGGFVTFHTDKQVNTCAYFPWSTLVSLLHHLLFVSTVYISLLREVMLTAFPKGFYILQ